MGLPTNSKCRSYLLFKKKHFVFFFVIVRIYFSSVTLHLDLSVYMSARFGFNRLFDAAIGSGVQLPTETMAPNSNTQSMMASLLSGICWLHFATVIGFDPEMKTLPSSDFSFCISLPEQDSWVCLQSIRSEDNLILLLPLIHPHVTKILSRKDSSTPCTHVHTENILYCRFFDTVFV